MKTPVKILLIEDNPADARLVREWLKEAGAEQFHLEHAERLDAGLKLLTEKGFDAVLLDLGLPDSQGLGALKAVRTKAPATPVVVLTGLSDEAVGMKAVQEGAQDYLIKGEIQESHLIRSLHYARERKGMEEQLLQAQKMEAVGNLAGGVAHDFNNVLTAIMGYSELILDALPEGHPEHNHIEEIRKAGERAAALTRQLLAFSRKQILQPEVLCLNEVVSGMTKMLKRMIPEDVELVAVLDPALDRVKLDPMQMEQVLMNLAVNARDAMPKGGKLTLETANAELDAAYTKIHPEIQPGNYVMLAVSDTGCGMDEEIQARIFEPFFTTKEKSKGTGLGLSTVYGIVKQSGGSIFVYSEPGKGTAFKIYLPRVEEVPGERGPAVEKRPVPALPQGAETVLVAEDDETLRRLIYEILQSSGYAVLEAGRGEEALRLAGEHAGPIHLLITDMVMPGMGGREVAGRLAALRPGTRVLYVSGYTDDAVVRHGVLESGVAFLQKPFVPEALLRKVREVLDGPEGPRV